jgi:hypothetical protein
MNLVDTRAKNLLLKLFLQSVIRHSIIMADHHTLLVSLGTTRFNE